MKIISLCALISLLLAPALHSQTSIQDRILNAYFGALVLQHEIDAKVKTQLENLSPVLAKQYEDLIQLGSQEDALLQWTYFYEKLERLAGGPAAAELCREGQRADWLVRRFKVFRLVDTASQSVIDTAQSLHRLSFFNVENGDRVAEVGFGYGFNLNLLSTVYEDIEIYANELNIHYLTKMEKQVQEHMPANRRDNFRYITGAPQSTNLEGYDLDLIIMENVLHHVEDKTTFLNSLAKSIHKKGEIVIIEEFKSSRPGYHKCPDLMWRPEMDQLFKTAGFRLAGYSEIGAQFKTMLRFVRDGEEEK